MARARAKLPVATSKHDISRVSSRQQAAALLVAAKDAVKINDLANGTVSVRSHDGKLDYSVMACAETATMSCECGDYHVGFICKHLRAAIQVLKNANAYVNLCAQRPTGERKLTLSPQRGPRDRRLYFSDVFLTKEEWLSGRQRALEAKKKEDELLDLAPARDNVGRPPGLVDDTAGSPSDHSVLHV